MARRLDHLEAADAIAVLEEHVGLSLQLRPRARELVVDDVLPRVDAGVELGHRDLLDFVAIGIDLAGIARH